MFSFSALGFLGSIVPPIAFIFLFLAFRQTLLNWRQDVYESKLSWTVFELKIPRQIEQSPQAMDQVLQAIHTIVDKPTNIKDRYVDGKHTVPTSFEMVSWGGQMHFYVRVLSDHRAVVESAFFSFYPDVEVTEVEDYMKQLPHDVRTLKAQGQEVFTIDMKLNREGVYPIKTYIEFDIPDEEARFDPIAVFMEVLGKLKKEEFLAVTIHALPMDGEERRKKYEEELEKLRNAGQEEKGEKAMGRFRTKEEDSTLAAVERNLSKPSFLCAVRFAYIAPTAIFSGGFPRRGVAAAFNQYLVNDRNGFSLNMPAGPMADIWHWPHVFPGMRQRVRQARTWRNFRTRTVGPIMQENKLAKVLIVNSNRLIEGLELSTEELATIFHPPTQTVLTAPHTERVESKKRSAPSGIPIFAEEAEIKDFMSE